MTLIGVDPLIPARAASALLVHGAGSDPTVFGSWMDRFAACRCVRIDLQRSHSADGATMRDYADAVVSDGRSLPRPLALCGWSMGGLVAWMAVEELRPDALILIEPSPPAQVQGSYPGIPSEHGTFDPKEVYGPFPEGFKARS
ncbi:MAG: alpha/beta hydrolase, partial [Actinomycetota bacterium]|nr:alpha/beta hydrolase [Actinomycetota bacterium]